MTTNRLRFVEAAEDVSAAEKKDRLRAYMRERRGENENRDVKEVLMTENFFKAIFDETTGAGTKRTVFVYLSFSSETPTDRLIESLLQAEQKVYCPRVENGEMFAVLYGEELALSDLGIREPVGSVWEGEPDVIVLPLLAVDEKGGRLGYGGGYYDKYLKRHPKAKRVAYCYDFQIVNSVPTEAGDERVDVIVTDKRIVVTKGSS